MDLNATLIGQIITFAIFIWFVMKFIWPPLVNIMQERQRKIAQGLQAAEKGHRELELAEIKSKQEIKEAKAEAARILESAHQQATQVIELAKQQAREEGKKLITLAYTEIDQQRHQARKALLKEVSGLALLGAEKILQSQIDANKNTQVVDALIGKL